MEIDKTTLENILDGFKKSFGDNLAMGVLYGRNGKVEGLRVPEQESTPHQYVLPENILSVCRIPEGAEVVGLGHYHGEFAVYQSEQDKTYQQFLSLRAGKDLPMLIVNKEGEHNIF